MKFNFDNIGSDIKNIINANNQSKLFDINIMGSIVNGNQVKIYKNLSKYQDTGKYYYIGFYRNNPPDLSVLDKYKLGTNPNLSFE